MDGALVELGDIVYDILLGAGAVASINHDGSFIVQFDTKRMTYQPGGVFMGVRRLYWANPIVYLPKKDDGRKLSIIKTVIELLSKEL